MLGLKFSDTPRIVEFVWIELEMSDGFQIGKQGNLTESNPRLSVPESALVCRPQFIRSGLRHDRAWVEPGLGENPARNCSVGVRSTNTSHDHISGLPAKPPFPQP